MIRLDTHLRKLQAVLGGAITTSQPTAVVCYTDIENENQKKFFIEAVTSTLNGATAVDILPAPDKAMVREVDSIHIRNNDTVAATITVRINDSGTNYELVEVTIQAGETLFYTDSDGWKVITVNGNTASAFGYIDFDANETPALAEGRLFWDSGDGSLTLGLKGGNTALQLGQENVALAYNDSGVTITAGSVVAVSGAQGQRPKIVLADADSEPLSAATLGIAAENISTGTEGFICTFGLVRGIDTSTFTAGNPVYLSQTAGKFTETRPPAPAHTVFLGWIIKVNASSGELFVNISNGWELDELHNVLISSPTNGQTLTYDTGLWKNGTLGTVGGGTGLTSFTANGVVYASSTSALSTGSSFVFDGSNVGIGTASPGASLDVNGNIKISGTARRITGDFDNATFSNRILFQSSTTNGETSLGVIPNGAGKYTNVALFSDSSITNSPYTLLSSDSVSSVAQLVVDRTGTGTRFPLAFIVGGSERMRIDTSGNVGIGTSSPALITAGQTSFTVSGSTGRGNVYVTTAAADGTGVFAGSFAFQGGASTSSNTGDGRIAGIFAATEGSTANNRGGYLIFNTKPDAGSITERMRIDSNGKIGVGVTPSAWGTTNSVNAIQFPSGAVWNYSTLNMYMGQGYYYNGTNRIYSATSLAVGEYSIQSGAHVWYSAASGTAGNTITLVETFRISINGNVIVNNAAIATNATAGFLWIPSCAGAPTGAPTAPYTNAAALVADTTNNRLYVRIGSTWKYASLI